MGKVHSCRERLIGDDAGKIRLRLIFREHALQLGMLVGNIIYEQSRTPRITKSHSRAHI
jgi:hypothetical protein